LIFVYFPAKKVRQETQKKKTHSEKAIGTNKISIMFGFLKNDTCIISPGVPRVIFDLYLIASYRMISYGKMSGHWAICAAQIGWLKGLQHFAARHFGQTLALLRTNHSSPWLY
jgi:hypothetical protein